MIKFTAHRTLLLAALVAAGACKKSSGDPEVDKWIGVFEHEDREVFKHRAKIVGLMGLKRGDTVADVGAGTGAFLDVLADAVGNQGTVYAVDIAENMIAHMKRRAKAEGLTQVKTVLSTTVSVSLPDASADRMLVVATYHHFDDTLAMMTSIRNALKPGGIVWIVDFHRIEGVTTDEWVLNHVRAGEDVFTKEIEAAGLVKVPTPETPFLTKCYMIGFRRPADPP
jgi:ubiquinone/menaquinone biosynthesis C-methylase UbiE